jgi:hypothetical protein
MFQGLDTVGTHVTHGSNNFHSCIVIGITHFHKEINKHLTLGSSVNQAVSHWLLPLVMETTKHEVQGMIYNIVCPAISLEDGTDRLSRNVGNYHYSLLNSPEECSSQE